ncbi:MAG: hypothetical protein ACYTGL_29510 [Planctomycetota bacterium]
MSEEAESPTPTAVATTTDAGTTDATASTVDSSPETEASGNQPDNTAAMAPQWAAAEIAPADVKLKSRTVLDGALTLDVPIDFHVMSREAREKKYPVGDRPSFILTNATEDVNIAFNLTRNAMTPQELPDFQRQMASLFRSQVSPDGWLGSQTVKINGLDWFTIEMRTDAPDSSIWNLIAGTSFNNRLLLVSFNATSEYEAQWAPVGRKMLQSLQATAEPATSPKLSQSR